MTPEPGTPTPGTREMPDRGARPALVASPVFVGREKERAALRVSLDEVLSGHGRLTLLVGEPGIGKTRLAGELTTEAQQRGVQVLLGHCYEGEGAPPFWPWVQIVRTYITHSDSSLLRAEMGVGVADIAQVIPEVREQLPEVPLPPPSVEAAQARFRFFESLTAFLKTVSQRQPLLLVLDDLQWADTPSLLLLQFLVRELRGSRLFVVGAYRDLKFDRRHPLMQTLGEVVRTPGTQTLPLRGLNEPEIADFLEQFTGHPASEALVTALRKETDGNPFFLTEVVHLLVSTGLLGESEPQATPLEIPIPQGVRVAIARRLQALSAGSREVLSLAAVMGREFEVKVLEALAAAASSVRTGERLLETLEEAVAARVISEVPRTVGRYSFAHALIRETLYEELSSTRRVRLHRQIGEILEKLYETRTTSLPLTTSGQMVAELAYHFFQAAQDAHDVDRAILYAIQAGERAMAVLAYEDAVLHYQHALDASSLKEPGDESRRCELLLALGEAQKKSRDSQGARETFERAAEVARALGARQGVPPAAAFLARAALGFGREWWDGAVIVDHRLITLLAEALASLGEGDSTLRVYVLSRLAVALSVSPTSERKSELSQQAVEMARRVGDPAAVIYALSARHFVLWEPQHVQERLAITTEIGRLAEAIGDRERELWGRNYRIANLLELGEVAAAEKELTICAQLATELRHPRYVWVVTELQALWALLEGRFAEAEQISRQAFALGRRIGGQTATLLFEAKMLLLRWGQGRLQELSMIEGKATFATQHPTGRSALAWFYSELGLEAEARHVFTAAAQHDFHDLPRDVSWLLSLGFLARACAFLSDTQRAAVLYDLLLPHAGHNIVVPGATFFYGCISQVLGLLATVLLRWQEAEQHFTDALAMYKKMRARPWVAHVRYEYARMLLTRNQPDDRARARDLLTLALTTAQKLGMAGLEEQVKSQNLRGQAEGLRLKASGVSLSSPYSLQPTACERPQSPTPNLFRHDGEYWTLAYQGQVCRLKDAKGLRYIATLLRHAGQEFHSSDLAVMTDAQQPTPQARARRGTDATEGVRKTVTNNIRNSLVKIRATHPALWRHLVAAVKTGTFCSYNPEQPVSWEL